MSQSLPASAQNQRLSWSFAAPVPTSARTLRIVFGLWIIAFFFKHAGASWDLSWHFRYLRDDLIPPHMLNLFGNGIAVLLLLFQFRTGIATERRGFLVLLLGFFLFTIAIPLDLINHRLFGLDATIWSPPHLLLFFGSAVGVVGLLWMWHRLAEPDPWKNSYSLIFLAMLMDCVIFVLGQFEYGVLSIDAYLNGRTTAAPELVAAARDNVERFATGPAPLWVYPVWMVLTATLVLLSARAILPSRWTATIVVSLYLAYRALAYLLLVAAEFPPSFIPIMLLGAGLAIDLAARWRWPALIATIALLGAFYGGAALVDQFLLMPEFALWTALAVALPLWGMFVAAGRWNRWKEAVLTVTRVSH